ncbi:MAG: nitroreductase family protein [Eubacteriales bacterium]
MDAIKAIYSRRSIRAHKNRQLSQRQIDTILAAGCSAPSAHNGRPWEFIVVKDKETISALSGIKKYYKAPLSQATCAIAVLINPTLNEKEKLEYKFQDCAAATQNMLISATALGLGSCWMGGLLEESEMKNIRSILGIPEPIIFFGLVSFGYPNEKRKKHGKIEAGKVHFEKY